MRETCEKNFRLLLMEQKFFAIIIHKVSQIGQQNFQNNQQARGLLSTSLVRSAVVMVQGQSALLQRLRSWVRFQRRLKIFHNISVFTLIFYFSFRDTHLGHQAFVSFLYNLLSQHPSFFPSSSLLFLCVQVVQSKQMFFLYLCSLST